MKLNGTLFVIILSISAFGEVSAKSQVGDTLPGVAVQSEEYFYTGKPYGPDLGAYLFKYRSYDPMLARWSSLDPAGFRDCANNHLYAPVPTFEFDPLGLEKYTYGYSFYGYYKPNPGGTFSLVVTTATGIGSLATSGTVSLVLSTISAGVAAVPPPPASWSVVDTRELSGWNYGEAPPAGGIYNGLSVSTTVFTPANVAVYYPDEDTSGTNFFSPLQNGVLSELVENGETPHPDIWAEQAPEGMAYPGTNGSFSVNYMLVRFGVTITLDVE